MALLQRRTTRRDWICLLSSGQRQFSAAGSCRQYLGNRNGARVESLWRRPHDVILLQESICPAECCQILTRKGNYRRSEVRSRTGDRTMRRRRLRWRTTELFAPAAIAVG